MFSVRYFFTLVAVNVAWLSLELLLWFFVVAVVPVVVVVVVVVVVFLLCRGF